MTDDGRVALVTGAARRRPDRQRHQRRRVARRPLGARPIPEGAASVVWAAMLPDDGPTGSFFRDGEPHRVAITRA
jgi:hypothetical protein